MGRTRHIFTLVVVTTVLAVGCSGSSGGSSDPDADASDAAGSASSAIDPTTTAAQTGSSTAASSLSPEAEALARTMQGSTSASMALPVDEEQATCVAPRWIETFGSSLDDAGSTLPDLEDPAFSPTTLDLSVEQGEAMVDAAVDCGIDVIGPYLRGVTGGLNPEQTSCVTDGFDADMARSLIAHSVADDLSPELQDLYRSCDIET